MGNYVIRRQSDGEVYLAHAGTTNAPKTERPGHKYILRLLTRAGARYFYTPEQVRAFYNSVKAKAGDPLGYNAQRDAMKKGMKVITTQGQENTAKWKVDKKPTAENKNNYERAKAANNYAQRDYYDAKKASEKGVFGKLSSALKGKPSENSQKSDQNGRSRGQSNLYKTDKYGNTYRPGVISDKPKGYMQSQPQGKEEKEKPDWKDNRPEGRKRNVTGKAELTNKKAQESGIGSAIKDHKDKSAAFRKTNEIAAKAYDDLLVANDEFNKQVLELKKNRQDMTSSEYGRKYSELMTNLKDAVEREDQAHRESDKAWDEMVAVNDELDKLAESNPKLKAQLEKVSDLSQKAFSLEMDIVNLRYSLKQKYGPWDPNWMDKLPKEEKAKIEKLEEQHKAASEAYEDAYEDMYQFWNKD